MDTVKLCAAAMIIVTAAVLLRQFKPDMSLTMRLCGWIFLLAFALVTAMPVFGYLGELSELSGGLLSPSGSYSYVGLLLRALGVCILTQCTADVCRDCGESGIASGVELAGKAELLLLALPPLKEIVASVLGMM